jgi:glyoxylase-like metal-dependent hydrolase (beta-lactamase superfamily II)
MPDDGPWICPTCGAHHPPAAAPPAVCAICADERQWVPPTGQRWTTLAQLAAEGTRTEVREVEPGLVGIGVHPSIGVGHRGLLVATDAGGVLWDPPPFLDAAAIDAVRDRGGLIAVTASHPHMYGAIVEWSRAFAAPIVLPEADAAWLMRPDPAVRRWSGTQELAPGITLVQCGGHFPGSAVLHWAGGAEGRGVLLVGDTLFVTPGEDRVTFAYSAPNRLPLPARAVRGLQAALEPLAYDRIHGGWWDPVLRQDAKAVVQRSADRYVEILEGEVGP